MVFSINFFVYLIFRDLKKLFSKFFFYILVELEIWRLFKKKIVQFDKEMAEKNVKYSGCYWPVTPCTKNFGGATIGIGHLKCGFLSKTKLEFVNIGSILSDNF